MDVLDNKNYAKFDYTSRYANVPYYYHTLDEKYVFGLGSNFKKNTSYVIHNIKPTDTLDYLALKYYNNPTYYWIICYFNDIQDAFIDLPANFKTIKIPNISSVQFGANR